MKNFSKELKAILTTFAAVFIFTDVVATSEAFAQQGSSPIEVTLSGGVQGILDNETALQDNFVNIPVTAGITYHVNSIFAVEGEFGWLIPIENSVNIGSGQEQDLKNPDILSYQANIRATLPLNLTNISTYATAGLGGVTFLSTDESNQYPQLDESETMFAINFGVGSSFSLTGPWLVRADFREFVAFPQNDAVAFSNGGEADPIWMPRGTLGVSYQF